MSSSGWSSMASVQKNSLSDKEENIMEYIQPEVEIIKLSVEDVITDETSTFMPL